MIAAARLRTCQSSFDLLRTLGFDVCGVAIVAGEWRRAGIEIGWGDAWTLHLATRTRGADIYALDGHPEPDAIARFLRSLETYNVLTKAILVVSGPAPTDPADRRPAEAGPTLEVSPARHIAIYDLSPRRELRRLDIDLDQVSPHALDRLNLLVAGDGVDVARLFDRALDRDVLTRQFFDRFRASVQQVAEILRDSFRSEPRDAAAAEGLLILSRMLFLYFIQQKGWLNGERRFLVDRLDKALRDGRNFSECVLLPLFFGCLNTPIAERDDRARRLGAIPYLNGGLFEPSPFERRHPDIQLPNDVMQSIIDGTFERFAFTIDETDAAGMHVDPEMLGKVFESLMAADERAASGSFYTPREIVDVLTQRALYEWLDIDYRDEIDAVSRRDAERVMQRLERVTILDPACGSGAFLLSALSRIEAIGEQLASLADVDPPSRQSIIERSLFGVDLKPEAVRLCELRLWLAIVANERVSIDAVPPLPNLDRNILQGNSLLSPTDFLGNARGDVYREWLYALRAHSDLITRYRSAPQHERPSLARLLRASDCRLATELLAKSIDCDEAELRELSIPQRDLFGNVQRIDTARCRELQQRIRESRRALDRLELGEVGFFSFDVHFAHVMAAGGFDIVAGNPPWVRNSRIDPRAKAMYSDRYRLFRGSRGNAAFHQPDLSVVFFERSLSLVAANGVVSLLVPSKLMNAAYATPLRRAAENERIVALHDWSDDARRHFDADTFPLGITIRRNGAPASAGMSRDRLKPVLHSVHVTAGGESFTLPQDALASAGSEWALLPPDIHRVVTRLHREHPSLSSVLGRAPVMGVKTGDNASFFIEAKRVRADSVETTDGIHIPLRHLCRCVRGRDVRRFQVADPAWMLWPPAGGWIRIPRWLERFAETRGIDPDDLQLAYVRSEHLGTKVVWKDVSRGIAAAVLRPTMNGVPLIPNQTLYALAAKSIEEAQVLAAILNSTIVNALAAGVAERAKDFHYRYFGRTMARIPFPGAWRTLTTSRTQIDAAVASLYGVTPAEHARLEAYLQRRLGHAVNED